MKKPTFSKTACTVLFLLLTLTSVGQTLKPFSIRKKVELKGKMLVIGNNILGKDNNPFNDNTKSNQDISMQYIDIDGDSNTFSSSSADLVAPTQDNGSASSCYRVAYAALYWGAMLKSADGSRANINTVKLKLPGATTYNNINGTVVYDAISTPVAPDNNTPYACYADVTSLLATLPSLTGTYTVADVISSTGLNGSTGLSAGWTLFVIYEDPTFTMKSFNLFDGFSHIYKGHTETIPVTGFRTPPSGTVDLEFAYAALDGDKPQSATKLEFGTKEVKTPLRPANKFFSSTIENSNGVTDPRNPSGSNTLGYDTGMLEVISANPEFIDNNQTSTYFTLQVAPGQADPIFSFMGSYAVDIIAPDIKLTKLVKNSSGTDIGGADVTLGDYLYYEINYQNLGNDNVTGMTMTDVLPKNIIFNYPADLDLTNAGGVTVQSYDAATRTIIFNVPNTSVEVGDPNFTIRIRAQIVPDCNMLVDACSNEIKNQATATYKGVINTNTFDTSSFSSTGCNFGIATPTNFLVKIDNCKFTQRVVLCNTSVLLTGPSGYNSYVWSRTLGGSSIGTGQTYTATQTGVYYVHATSLSNCLPIDQEVTVVPFGNTVTNPVIPYAQAPYAGSVTTCTINGKLLPNLFLCGANDFRDIKTGITDATSIIWEKLNENGTCPAATSTTICANESASCSWSQVGTGPDYKANTAGQFRLTINYTGGCFSVFYFNVFQNLLNPTVVSKDITCNTQGQITVNGIPASGYEFSLDNGGTGTYQASNIFNNVSAGLHNVYIRQLGVTNACLFRVLNVQILNRIYQVNVNVTQPLCNGGKGSVTLQANNVLPQYYYSISQGATLVNSAGPINANDNTFSNLNPGTYTVRVWTDDGCDYSENIDIINPAQLTATAAVTKPLTCTDGEITVYPVGGTDPYIYYINSTTNFQNTATVAVTNPLPTGGIYNITVEDSNNCTATTSITVAATPAPVYAISSTNVLCYGDATGAIQFNVTSNSGGYTLSYSIDDGVTYSSNPLFSGLVAGTVYTPKLRYTLNGVDYCYDTKPTVTLTGPSTALTASAGVSELAGCGPAGEGKIRITNPQGGVAPYQYSFDNQATWTTVNEAYKAPGTYTVYIKDANGCIYAMPNIIIDPEPVSPTIAISSPVFNCNGTATTTATVTNSGSASYQYGYLLDGDANQNVPSNVFVNVPSGSHTVSVTYKLLSVPTYSNLLKEDFGKDAFTYTPTSSPDGSSPGINSAFCWERQVNATKCNADRELRNGEYTVTSSLRNNFYSGWNNPIDHTTGSSATGGRYLAVDAGNVIPNNAVLYRKTIKDIIPNQPIQVRFFATNLLKVGNNQPDASLTVELQNALGAPLSSSSTGGIPKTNGWVEYNKTIDPGNSTTLDFVLRLELSQVNGIDFAVDDIEVYQLPKTCITQVDFPFEVPTGKAFTGSVTGFKNITCAGANNGEITIAVQNFDPVYGFDYSIDGGTTWINRKTSPFTITGLAANTYTPMLRYNAAGACPLTLAPVTITAPSPVVANASVTQTATCTTGATITASASGGTPAYQYELRASDGTTVIPGFSFSSNNVFTNVASGNYKVFVRDANLCLASATGIPVNVLAPPTLSAAIDPTTSLCFDPTTGVNIIVRVTGGVGPFTYTTIFNGGTPSAASATFAGPTFPYNATVAGTYSFDVYDSNGCKAATISQVISDKLTASTTVTTALDCDVAPANQAVVTGTISGGKAPFTVTLTSGTGGTLVQPVGNANTFTYSNATAGNYGFQVKDANNCTAPSSATINALTPIVLASTNINPKCNGSADGSVQLNPSGGSGGFTYSTNGTTYNNTSLITGLSAGIPYTFYVKDSNKCTKSVTVTLTAPATINAIAAITTAYTCDNLATISVTSISGGTAPYNYTLNRGGTAVASNTTGVFNNISVAGSYTVTVTDANSCPFTTSPAMVINALNKPASMTISNSALTCPTNKATVTITNVKNSAGTVIASAGLQYRIVLPTATVFQASNSFPNLTPDIDYTFEVKDANNCSYTEVYKITPLPVFTVSLKSFVNETCSNAADGSAIFTVSGLGNGVAYTYKVDSGTAVSGTSPATGTSFDIPVTGLSAASHSITVTNTTTTCSAPANVTISAPTAVLKLNAPTLTHVTCLVKGTATINAVGGWGTNTYTVTPKSPAGAAIVQVNDNKFVDLGAGTYSVSVKDLSGCTVAGADFTINDKVAVAASISTTSSYCADADGATLVVTPTVSPQPNYRYSINGSTPAQVSGTFSGLVPGDYNIVVSDITTGCTLPLAKQTIALPLTASTRLLADLDCDVPPASPDASIEVTISGGYPDYKYRVNKTGAPFSGGYTTVATGTSVFTYTATTSGTYYFEITDSKNCTTVISRVINALVNPDFTFTQVDVKCKGGATGSITVTGVPAAGTYTYILTPTAPAGAVVSQTTNVFSNLKAGTYTVQVKDVKNCTSAAKTVTITEPINGLTATATVTTKASCDINNGTQAATITVTASGGTPYSGTDAYRYSYNGVLPPVTSKTYTTTTAGPVSVVVYDASGCPFTVPVSPVVNTLNPPKTMTFAQANTITCDPTKLDTDLTVSFLNGVSPFKVEITSTDAAVAPAAPIATGVVANNHTFTNLLPGTYYFKVTDANNCTLTGNYTIAPVVGITASGAISSNVTCNGVANGAIRFTVAGNRTGGYTYTLVGSVSGTIAGGSKVGDVITYSGLNGGEDYTFTVTNIATQCKDIETVTLPQPTAITGLTATASKVFPCLSPATTTIKVTASGGVSPLQYAVVKTGTTPVAADYNTTGIFTKDTSVDGLSYVAYVKDNNGNCPQNIPVSVTKDAAPTVGTPAAQCYSGTALTITMTGTVFAGSSIQYGINGVYTTNPVKTIPGAGSYNLTVKDDNGCISPVVVYDVKDVLTIATTLDKDITCTTVPPTPTAAQITLSAGGGTSSYTYAYRLAPSTVYITLPGNVYNPTVAGNYYFRVTSGGCSTETASPVQVTTPIPPTATTSITNLSCYQSNDGVVTLVPTAGAAPFTFSFNGSGFTTDATYSNLAASTGLGYPYKVRDSKGCEVSGYAIVTEPAQIDFTPTKTDMTCPGPTMGSITVSAITNGVAPFVYTVRNIVTGAVFTHNDATGATHTFSNVSYGDYEVTVSDSKSCSNVKSIQVLVPPSNLLINLTTPIASCADGATIIVTVNPPVVPATPLYQFGIYDLAVAPFSSALLPPDAGFPLRHTFTNLTPGVIYTFVIYDPSTNCYYFQKASGPVAPITPLTSSTPTAIPVTCKEANDGSVRVTIDNYTATSVKYEIFYAQSATSTGITGTVGTAPQTFTSPAALKPGTYYIKYTEVGGANDQCTSSSSTFVITESAVLLSLTATSPKNDNCKNNAGQVVAVASGGTGPYLYQIVADNGAIGFGAGDTAPTSASFVSPTHSASTFNVESGNYIVWVKDAYGCIKNATATVVLDPDPVFALSVPNKCATEGNFAVNVTVTDAVPTMAPYTVSVNGATFVNFTGLTYAATGLNSGLQTIIVKSKNDCPVTQTIPITPTPLATAVVSKPLDCSVSPTAVANATITVTVTKGTSPYTYEVKQGSGSYTSITPTVTVAGGITTFTYTVASANADTYLFRITDSNTCQIVTNPVVIDPIVPIVPAYNAIQPLCKGDSGTIELSATGGKSPYTYNFNNLGFSSQTVYSALAGTYSYKVKDALGCEVTGSAILGEPTAVVLGTPVVSPLTCGPGNLPQAATVDLSTVASGGTGTYQYSFAGSGFSSKKIYTVDDNGADQLNIPYKVKDANGCEKSGTVNIYKLDPPTNFAMNQSAVITCATTAVNVTISNVVNTAGPITTGLTYKIISPSSATSNVTGATSGIFTNLAPGNYVFQVTYAATGCVKQLPYEIKDVVKINIVEQSTTGITCSTAADGKASFLVSGYGTGVGTYRYELDGVAVGGNSSSPTINLTGLAKGAHTIRVIDNETTCWKSIPFNIASPTTALTATKVVTPLGCTTFGAVQITATGGWGNYEYTVTPPTGAAVTNNTGVFGGFTQTGLYNISIKDANGCIITDSFNLVTPTNPTAAIAASSDFCYDTVNGATLVVTASLGVAPYLFSIDNGTTFSPSNTLPTPNNTYTFNNLTPGSYDVVVKDAYGCKSTVPLNRVIKPQLFATAQNTKNIFCTGTVNGTIKIDAVGGYGSYTYTWAKDGGVPSAPVAFASGSNTANYSVTAPGSYVFVVYDARGCSYPIANAVVMTAPTPVTYTATPTSPSCVGTQGNVGDGSILVTLAVGNDNPDYTYTILRTAPTAGSLVSQVNNGLFTGLIAGTYTVTVTSARACSTPDAVVIDAPVALTAAATASPFTCSPTNTINVTTVTVTGTGGAGTGAVADYTYSENGTVWKTTNTFTVVDNGATQTPTYFVKDANGCIDDVQITIAKFPRLVSATASLVTKAACNNLGEVIKVDIVGGASPANFEYQVAINGGAYSTPAISIPAGALTFNYTASTAGSYYKFKITDKTTGCSIVSNAYMVPLFNIMDVNATVASNVSCNAGSNGAIEINISDYSGAYTYNVFKGTNPVAVTSGSGNTSTNPFVIPFGLTAGAGYRVEVTQTGYPNCTVTSADVEITEPAVLNLGGLVVANVNQNCKTAGAVLTVDKATIVGGTPGFTYAFVPSGNSPTGLFKLSNTATIATTKISPAFDVIDVWVQDLNGCSAMKTVHISADPLPVISSVVATQCPSATGTYDITVTATAFSSFLEYSLDGNSFQSSNVLTVTSPGNYTVTVRDANLCTTTATAPVTILKPLQLQADLTTVPTCLSANGEVTLTAGGGTPASYEYSLGGTTYGASNVFSGLAASATPYTFYVRDTATGCVKSVDVTILLPNTDIDFRLDTTSVTCKGGNDGTITVTLATPTLTVNNNPVYTYVLSGTTDLGVSVNVGPQAINLFSGLEAGNYTVVVTSGRGCPESQNIRVDEPALMVVPTPTVTPFGCTSGNAMNFATITVNGVTGGSGTYTIYEFFKNGTSVKRGASNIYTETDLAGGSYTVTVYDDKGCPGSTSTPITIAPFTPMDNINVVVNKAIDCNNPENITVTAVDASGVAIAGVQYTLVDKNATTGVIGGVYPAQTNTTGVFTGLTVANYIVTATNPTTGCSIQGVHYVNEPNTFDLTIDNIVDVTCFGGANGSANVTIVDKTMPDQAGPFSYTLVAPNGTSTTGNSSTAGPLILNSLVAGNYTVIATLTNNPFCSVSKVFAINQPTAALKISETDTPITCAGNDGTISATAIGGWPGGYEFALSGPVNVAYSAQSNFANLSAGLYTVSVRDSKGCVDQVQVTLANPTPIGASIVVDKPLLACFGDTNATITVQQPVTGGSGVYKYTLEATYPNGTVTLNGPQTSNVFANLGAGSYRVSVSDTWNCSVWTNIIVINQPTEVKANLVKATAQTCLSPATLTLSAAGGTGLYSYSADPNFATVLGSFTSSVTFSVPFTTVPAKYVYYVKDANGCSNAISNDIDVIPLEPLDFSFENINPYINCLGDNDGEITAIAKGGLGNYVYTLLDGSGNALPTTPTQLTPGYFSQLIAGNYILKVTSDDCQISKPITITQPNSALTYTAVVTNVTCNGNGDGKVVLTGSGGTGVIKYAISPDLDKFLDSGTFLNLAVGHYQAVIQDVNGCNHVYDFDITEPAPITAIVDPLSIKQELCSGEKTGEFTIAIAGGTGPYSTSIDGDTFVLDRVSFIGLSGGKHTVIVKDANLCEFTFDVLLNPAVTLSPEAKVSNECVNDLPANKVTVTVDPSNNPDDVTYSLDSTGTPQSSNVFTNLTPGDHFVMVQHKNGCIDATEPFTIEQIDPLAMSIDLGGLNEIVATVTGGSGVYRFSVNGVDIGSNNKYIYFHSGDYTVTVTDSNGCSFSRTKYFEFIDIVIPPIFTPTGDGTNDTWKPTNTENYPDIKFVVYDRYGREVGIFGAGQSWDGKYNGTELPMGDYWYVLKLRHTQDDREFIGHFTLYR